MSMVTAQAMKENSYIVVIVESWVAFHTEETKSYEKSA